MTINALEFKSAAELRAHYAALISKMRPQNFVLRKNIPPIPVIKTVTVFDCVTTLVDLEAEPSYSLLNIKATVSEITKVAISDIDSQSRIKNVCFARQLFFYFANKYTAHSYPAIGRYCGGKDHSTVLYGCRMIAERRNGRSVANIRVANIVAEVDIALAEMFKMKSPSNDEDQS
jgi:hypothetical protein